MGLEPITPVPKTGTLPITPCHKQLNIIYTPLIQMSQTIQPLFKLL